MERKIEFRAWIPSEKVMIQWDDLRGTQALEDGFDEIDSVLSQWTGFYDRNGRKIWEGDIVNVIYELNRSEGTGLVQVGDGCWEISFKKFENLPFDPRLEVHRQQDYLKMFAAQTYGRKGVAGSCEVMRDIWS